jgi:hypothetical protein
MLGRYDQEPVALRTYGLLLVAIALMWVVIWLYATNRPHLLWQRLDAPAACSPPAGVRAAADEY